jgi:hypothetical protein
MLAVLSLLKSLASRLGICGLLSQPIRKYCGFMPL